MKKFWTDFKKFIAKGNVVDMAVAVIIGSAFNKIVSSLVNDVIMPLISLAVGGADVSDWKWVIKPAEYDASGNVTVAETALKYGTFLQTIIDFLIIALTVFLIVKLFTATKNKLGELGQNIVTETKKLSKRKKKKGQVEETEVVAEVATEEKEPEKVEAPAQPKPEEKPAQPETPVVNADAEMIMILKEIRDSLRK